jgi:ribonuclease HI
MEFDYIIQADGAGGTATTSCGFYALLTSTRTGRSIECYGGFSHGTNNFAELVPFVHALWKLESLNPIGATSPRRVLCVSDSEVTVRCGNGQYTRKANLSLWAAIDWFVAQGYELSWKHVPRNSDKVGRQADATAKDIRAMMSPTMRAPR